EVHKYSFYVMKDTVMNTTITADSTAKGLVPELTLFSSDEKQVDLGAAQAGNKIKSFKFAASGDYYLRVRATAGTGIYKLDTKSKFPAKITGSTTTGTFAFDAAADIVLGASVKKNKGSGGKPVIAGLVYNGGAVDLGTFVGTQKFSKILLPVDATYTLQIT